MGYKFIVENDFQKGALVVIDKPLGWTSFDVVNKLKYALKNKLGFRKIKVGHAGTLDPLATGVLVVCIGKMTKQIEGLMMGEKEYTGTMCFGKVTPSYDLETDPEGMFETDHLNRELIQNMAIKSFTGEIVQYPPRFSAKKIDGKRAFDYAREGKEVKMRPNVVNVMDFEIHNYNDSSADFRVVCSKGTYIRSLAHDLGKALGSGAYLSSLRRTKSGEHQIEDSITVDEAVSIIQEHANRSSADSRSKES